MLFGAAVLGLRSWLLPITAQLLCTALMVCAWATRWLQWLRPCPGCQQIAAEQAANGVAGSFYNTSADVSVYGLPFAFYTRNFPHRPAGWPVIFINGLSAAACAELLQYLTVANFLDSRSATLTLEVVTYNADLSVFG